MIKPSLIKRITDKKPSKYIPFNLLPISNIRFPLPLTGPIVV